MRTLILILFCCFSGLVATLAAEENRPVESAPERWAAGGSGGAPDFVQHVVPLFSKLGCNNRACHGSFQGQNGFRLSLFGFEPVKDHRELLENDGDGIRTNVKDPQASLILFKPTHEDEHEGGERMKVGSWQYRMLQEWIAAGAKYDSKREVRVTRLKITPPEIILNRSGEEVTLRATAIFSDGTEEDVTGLTLFTSNDKSIADLSKDGQVKALRTGDTAIIAQYSGAVASTQVLVPAADDGQPYAIALPHNKIDEFVGSKLRKLRMRSSDLCSDGDFIRRVYLDVIGTLPTADETRKFLAARAPGKRAKLIDELLVHPAYARYWGMKFSDWTGNSKYINRNAMLSNWMWQHWLEDKLSRNVPYDEIVYANVCATSLDGRSRAEFLAETQAILHRAAGRYNFDDERLYARRRTNELYWGNVERRNPETMVLQTANAFLGIRLECAQCHNHPFDRWTQKDFEQFKSIFMMVRFCVSATGEERKGAGRGFGVESVETGVSSRFENIVRNTPPKMLGGPEVPYKENGPDVRVELWKWMRAPENPYFAPSFVNRLWDHYFGIGIVDSPDDINQGNPPSNPQLLSWLADEFIEHKFDIQYIHRLILNSRTYQMSWEPNDSNRLDKKNFSHAQLRRMPAEVLMDAIADVTGVANDFGPLPKDQPQRAVGQAMPPLRYGSTRGGYAMKIFGRPDREKTCDCERSNEPSVAQALYLINDVEVLGKINNLKGTLPKLLKSMADDGELITQLYLATLARFPTEAERDAHRQHVSAASSRAEGMKDVLWSLLNVREFVFVH